MRITTVIYWIRRTRMTPAFELNVDETAPSLRPTPFTLPFVSCSSKMASQFESPFSTPITSLADLTQLSWGKSHKSLYNGPPTQLHPLWSHPPNHVQEKHHVHPALEAMYEHQLDGFRQWLLVQSEWTLRAKKKLGKISIWHWRLTKENGTHKPKADENSVIVMIKVDPHTLWVKL